MPFHLVANDLREAVALQISIEEWRKIKNKYPDINITEGYLPLW